MLTIICSSIEPKKEFKEHIIKTSGLKDIEFLHFENKGTYSLTELYNKGLHEAKNDIVLFIHDDIKMKTKKWGKRLLNHFNETDYGILGLAGTYIFTDSGTWWEDRSTMVGIVNHKHPETKHEYESKYSASLGDTIAPVVLVDGVFFAVHKKRIKYYFDENIPGFHFYDIDFCLANHHNNVKLGCITNIRIVHDSIGQTNDQWEENKQLIINKWKNHLPITVDEIKMHYSDQVVKLQTTPKISILIPSKSANELLFGCIDSFLEKSDYTNYEIIVGDTGSEQNEIDEFNAKYAENKNINLIPMGEYHFATTNNNMVLNHVSEDSELLLFCNNDIELINDALSNMVKVYLDNRHSVGTVGARLYYKNNTIQHSGMMAYLRKNQVLLTHMGLGTRYHYHNGVKEVIGNTAALLLVNKKLFIKAGMFPTTYKECFEDVDLNVNLLSLGRKNYFVENAVAYHYESQTRNKSEDKRKNEEADLMVVTKKLVANQKTHKYLIRI